MDVQQLLGLKGSSSELKQYLQQLTTNSVEPEVKTYADTAYFNYHTLGLTLQLIPTDGYKLTPGLAHADLDDTRLVVDSIDVYNAMDDVKRKADVFAPFPSPITLTVNGGPIVIQASTTGKDFVESLGEPDRKGGGAGPSNGSIAIWCEWSKAGILVEFGGENARGPQAWEKGKHASWRVLTIFRAAL